MGFFFVFVVVFFGVFYLMYLEGKQQNNTLHVASTTTHANTSMTATTLYLK